MLRDQSAYEVGELFCSLGVLRVLVSQTRNIYGVVLANEHG